MLFDIVLVLQSLSALFPVVINKKLLHEKQNKKKQHHWAPACVSRPELMISGRDLRSGEINYSVATVSTWESGFKVAVSS